MRYIERPPAIPDCFPLAREAGEGRGEGACLVPNAGFLRDEATLILTFSRRGGRRESSRQTHAAVRAAAIRCRSFSRVPEKPHGECAISNEHQRFPAASPSPAKRERAGVRAPWCFRSLASQPEEPEHAVNRSRSWGRRGSAISASATTAFLMPANPCQRAVALGSRHNACPRRPFPLQRSGARTATP
jgi:hypothetical protein